MMVMGDELAKTHDGNNNWYGHDTGMAHVQWDAQHDDAKAGLLRFMSELINWRVECPLLGRAEFLG
jgi:isoamylase